jgi:hypothetical protein
LGLWRMGGGEREKDVEVLAREDGVGEREVGG